MSKCINITHPSYIVLQEATGQITAILSARIQEWMEKNNQERFPTLSELNGLMPSQTALKKELDITTPSKASNQAIINLKMKIARVNASNKNKGVNIVYAIKNITQIGQLDQYTYKLEKYETNPVKSDAPVTYTSVNNGNKKLIPVIQIKEGNEFIYNGEVYPSYEDTYDAFMSDSLDSIVKYNFLKNPVINNISDEFFEGNKSINASSILEKIVNDKGKFSSLAQYLLNNLSQDPVVTLVPVIRSSNVGKITLGKYYLAQHKIELSEDLLNRNADYVGTILHEIIHAQTASELRNNPELATKVEKLRLHILENTTNKDNYHLTNVDELLAGMFTDPKFISELENIPAKNNTFLNILQELFATILKALGVRMSNNVYSEASQVFSEVVEAQKERIDMLNQLYGNIPEDFFTPINTELSLDTVLFQEVGKNLEKLSNKEIENLQSTIENQLIIEQDDDLIIKGGQSYVYLNDKDAENFKFILDKTKEFPKEFKVTKKITKYERDIKNPLKYNGYNEYVDFYYIKLNNNKKSNLYQIVNKETGEIIAEKVRLLHLSQDSKSKIAEQYGVEFKPTKVFSANRSIAFALYRQKPSKAKYIAQAKKYLYDALKFINPDETSLKINLDKIEKLLDSFPNEMWDYINTTYSPEDSTNINASTSLQNEIRFNLPKLGLLQEIEKIVGIPIQGVSFINYDRTGALAKQFKYSKLTGNWGDVIVIDHATMTTKQLIAAISYYLTDKKIFKPTSAEENVRKYAEHYNLDYKELKRKVLGDFDEALNDISYNTTGNSDHIELSKWRESVRTYDWQTVELFNKPYENFQNTVKERITEKFKDKTLSNGISHLEYFFSSGAFNWLNINFNNISGQYYMFDMETQADTGVETKMGGIINPFEMKIYHKPKAGENFLREEEIFNRLAAILHEPFHALHALSYGTKEEKELREAFDNLYKTDFGKELMSQVFGSGYNKSQNISYDTLYKEFTAFTTQIMLYPKEWINNTDLRSNDIVEFIQKIQSLQDKTYIEIVKTQQKIGTTETTILEEERIKLSFLEKLYNYLVKALNKIIPLSKKFLQTLPESKIVSKQVIEDIFGTVEEEVTKTLKLPENVKKSKEEFLQKMEELQVAINTLMQIDGKLFSSDNIINFFTNNNYNQETGKTTELNIVNPIQQDLQDLNFTPAVLNYLYENNGKSKEFSIFVRDLNRYVDTLRSIKTNEEIVELLKCL
ncbi:MAG: hypothetical protein EOL97_04635 [Spirochaetia bacterium]|nr:hypothetical protein [Spirochaetia bacterium]